MASTATAAAAPAAAGGETQGALPAAKGVAVVPSAVLFKVGDDGHWSPFEDEKLLGMDASDLLEALADSRMFALDFKDVGLSACSIAVVKNSALPAGAKEPSAEQEAGDSVVVMKGAETVGDMANGVGASGAPLFVRVGLPTTVHAGERRRSGAVAGMTVHDEDCVALCRGSFFRVHVCIRGEHGIVCAYLVPFAWSAL